MSARNKGILAFKQSIVFKLSVWYASILVALSLVFFIFFFSSASRSIKKISEDEIKDEVNERVVLFKAEGIQSLKKAIVQDVTSFGGSNISQSILDPNGRILFTYDSPKWGDFKVDPVLLKSAFSNDKIIFSITNIPGFKHKVRVAYARLSANELVRIAIVMRHEDNFLNSAKKTFIETMILILVINVITGGLMIQHAMGRVIAVTDTAISISSSSLDKRVSVSQEGDEIDHLAKAFNSMLDRIQQLVKGLHEITDNVAHDLKIPLTRIRLIAESLSMVGKKPDIQETAKAIIEESDRLLEIINTTLEIKAIETSSAMWELTEVDISGIIQQASELFQLVAEEKSLTLQVKQLVHFYVNADIRQLQRVFANLIENAIKYTPAGGTVVINMSDSESKVIVEISDTGIGISSENLSRIFERFYRADKSRSIPGLGLGLSLAQSIVKAHGGVITVKSTKGAGSTFTVILPGREIK